MYLGSEMDWGGGLAGEVGRRVAAGRRSFWGLRRLWRDGGVSVGVKARVYAAVVRSVLLYATETWPARLADVRALEVFDRWCLRRVVGGKLAFGMSSVELMRRAGLADMGELVRERRWRWLGHVLRMGSERWPRRCLELGGALGAEGAGRVRGGRRMGWLRLVLREWRGGRSFRGVRPCSL